MSARRADPTRAASSAGALSDLSRLTRALCAGEEERVRLAAHQARAEPVGMSGRAGTLHERYERLRHDPLGELITWDTADQPRPAVSVLRQGPRKRVPAPEKTWYQNLQWDLLKASPELVTDDFVYQISDFIRTGDTARVQEFLMLFRSKPPDPNSFDPAAPIGYLPNLTEGAWVMLAQALLDRNAEFFQTFGPVPGRARAQDPMLLRLSPKLMSRLERFIGSMFGSGADMIPSAPPSPPNQPYYAIQSDAGYHRIVELQVALTLGGREKWPKGLARTNPHYGLRTNHPTEWAHVVQFDKLDPAVSNRIDALMNLYGRDIGKWLSSHSLGGWPREFDDVRPDEEFFRRLTALQTLRSRLHPADGDAWISVCSHLAAMGHKFDTLSLDIRSVVAQFILIREWIGQWIPNQMSTEERIAVNIKLVRLWESGLFEPIDDARKNAIKLTVDKAINKNMRAPPTTRSSQFCRRGSQMMLEPHPLSAAVSMLAFKDTYAPLRKMDDGRVVVALHSTNYKEPVYLWMIPSTQVMLDRALDLLRGNNSAEDVVRAIYGVVELKRNHTSVYRFNAADVRPVGQELVLEALDRVPVSEWLAMGHADPGADKNYYDFADWLSEAKMPWPAIREWVLKKLPEIYDPARVRTPEEDAQFPRAWGPATPPPPPDAKRRLEDEITSAGAKRTRTGADAGAGQCAGRLWHADGSQLYVGLLNEHGQPHGFGVGTSAAFALAGVWADGKHVQHA